MLFRVLGVFFLLAAVGANQRQTFKAAVYEHEVILPFADDNGYSRQEAVNIAMQNLIVYNRKAMSAAQTAVDILVFPEGGLYGWNFDRNTIKPFLEYVPGVDKELWNPCTNPNMHPGSKLQHELSCIARNNSIYIVANLGSKSNCNDGNEGVAEGEERENEACPEDGVFQYNTAVVYDNNGNHIAKYNKWNLYNEPQFDQPEYSERVTFETPFGIFGLFMCSEMNQFDPAIRLIEELAISNFACSGSWQDIQPNRIAIQDHAGFARGYGINLLAANIHNPDSNRQGSGVYAPDGQTRFYYDNRAGSDGRLVIASVKVLRRPIRHKIPKYDVKMQTEGENPDSFTALINNDEYRMIILSARDNRAKLCASELCCELEYSVSLRGGDEYVFGVYTGYHLDKSNHYRFYQSCLVTRCVNASEEVCDMPTTTAHSYFTHLRINAFFMTQFVIPQFLVSNRGQLDVVPDRWQYQDGVLWSRQTSYALESAGFFGRIFSRDSLNSSQTVSFSLVLLISCVLLNFSKLFNS